MRFPFPILLLLLLAACGKDSDKAAEAAALQNKKDLLLTHVRTIAIGQATSNNKIDATAVVSSNNEARPSFKTGGIILRMLVNEGDNVKAGQLLATMNLTEINAQVQQAEEGLAKAQRDLQRAKNLYADSVATLETVQNANTGVELAQRTVQIAQFNRSYAEVRAPIAGKIIKLLQREGEIVGPGMPVCYILGAASADWRLNAGLSDRDWARVKIGDAATVQFDAYPGQTFAAKVSDLALTANPASGTFDVELRLNQGGIKMAAGLLGRVSITAGQKSNQTLLPIEALVDSDGNTATVFALEGNVARAHKVKIRQLLGAQVDIASGLEDISEIISTGAAFLSDGEQVVVVR